MSSGSAHPRPAAPGTPAPGAVAARRKAASAAGGREVFRLAPPVVFWWIWLAFAVANLADFAIQGTPSARFTIVVTAILVTVSGLVYVLALRPKVIAGETGITVVNPFRDHQIPWGIVQAVDAGDWVRVHYAPAVGAQAGCLPTGKRGKASSSASDRTVYCWALYVSARTKRRSGRIAPRPRRAGLFRPLAGLGEDPGYGGQSRLPEEARYLASLPVSKAIAARLDTRAARERKRASADGGDGATATWSWPAIAAIAVPALILLTVALAR
ncbi:MAG: PH domain-containing protein [Trebonia sp.]